MVPTGTILHGNGAVLTPGNETLDTLILGSVVAFIAVSYTHLHFAAALAVALGGSVKLGVDLLHAGFHLAHRCV